MSATDDLLQRNERYAERFQAGELPAPPATGVAVVTCMDARIDAHAILGLAEGDAHVIRNAGGVVTDDVVRSLAISQRRLGTREVLVIQHTRCGMRGLAEDELREEIAAEAGSEPDWPVGAFADLEESVRSGVARLREDAALPHRDGVRGFVYDVETGRLREVG